MLKAVEYAGFKMRDGKPTDRVTNYYKTAKQAEKEILEGQFQDGETIGLVRQEIHQIPEMIFTASLSLKTEKL